MRTETLNIVIDNFNALLPDEKELAVDIFKKSYAEERREAIFKTAQKVTINAHKGRVKQGNINDLYNDLEND
ncbi:MAG: hypothetical protein HY958_14745 [Bacteroidia bacterium]|nr:hypothetical protein [Bacteroidia bacterium]